MHTYLRYTSLSDLIMVALAIMLATLAFIYVESLDPCIVQGPSVMVYVSSGDLILPYQVPTCTVRQSDLVEKEHK